MFKRRSIFYILATLVVLCLGACSNSESVDYTEWEDSSSNINYLPIDDTEYPYAGIPRIVIETENHRAIEDRETEIPAKLQIWGEKAPESEIMDLTIRGRGNNSWWMPQKSYKIEFTNKQSMLGMPKDRDWALIANYADKTLMKNYLAYHLSAKLGAFYTPHCDFVELYLNKEYLGVYLLTETIKKAKKRVNIPDSNSYIVEIDGKYRNDEQVVFSPLINQASVGKAFRIHYPKNASEKVLHDIETYIQSFEKFLTDSIKTSPNINQWIDINEYVKHYWVQEFSKNPDAEGHTSIYFSWVKENPIRMGPVWDFDLAFGSYSDESFNVPENWYIKKGYWHSYIFKNSVVNLERINFWKENRNTLTGTIDVADSICILLQNAAANNFKKWNILKSTEYLYHRHNYATYEAAVEDLKNWIRKRIAWIDTHI